MRKNVLISTQFVVIVFLFGYLFYYGVGGGVPVSTPVVVKETVEVTVETTVERIVYVKELIASTSTPVPTTSPTSTPTPTPTPLPLPTKPVTTLFVNNKKQCNVNIRTEPSTESHAFTQITFGQVVSVVDRVVGEEVNGNGIWYEVECDSKLRCFVWSGGVDPFTNTVIYAR